MGDFNLICGPKKDKRLLQWGIVDCNLCTIYGLGEESVKSPIFFFICP